MNAPGRLLTTDELAEYLGVTLATVCQWRHKGTAPPAVRLEKHLR